MIDLEDLFFEIFEALRLRRVPLGMPDYLLALELVYPVDALNHPEQIETIKSVCRLFWVKSYEDLQLFDETFDIEMNKRLAQLRKKQAAEEAQRISASETPSSFPPLPNRPGPQNPPLKKQPEQKKRPLIAPNAHSQPASTAHTKMASYQQTVRHHLTPRLPIEKRDMAGIWRKLRRPQREGPLDELDVQATTDALSQTGFLLKPVLQSRRRNQAKLVLLIDQGGSMEPFSLFIAALQESLLRSGSLKQVSIFYFHDCPETYVYTSPALLGTRSLEDMLGEHGHGSSVLVVSDAGAARGDYDSRRIRTTKEFLDTVGQYTYLTAWLNPVPKVRWTGTTAWHIAQLLPMFQLDWEGLNDVVNILRGQTLSGVQQP